MRLKLGLVLGFAIGYLMGTKAGRYRYDQIMKMFGKVAQSEPAQKARAQAERLVDEATNRFKAGSHDEAGQDTPVRAVTLP
jgi:tryptophan synthase beta subunit